MPRATLKLLLGLALAALPSGLLALDPHMDPSFVPEGCNACHKGHGLARSPMLPAPQVEVCLSCHGSDSRRAGRSEYGRTSGATTRPQAFSSVLAKPFVHRIDDRAFSRHEPGRVTCTSCHSPHRGTSSTTRAARPPGTPKRSPRNPSRLEYELCESCHGRSGRAERHSRSVGERLDPRNRSYHPVKAPSRDGAPSVAAALAGREINCTDCHGNNDRGGPRGPHGSSVKFLLVAEYVTVDGSGESDAVYALCYTCHDRESVLDSPGFPQHRLHVVDRRISCAACHDAHGSFNNRALIRFGDEEVLSEVAPSGSTGQLGFASDSPGSGSCSLTCHGHDHAGTSYGTATPSLPLREPYRGDRSPLRDR